MRTQKYVSVIFNRDDGHPDQMTMSPRTALRARRLAEAKALPMEAIMNILAALAEQRIDKWLDSQGV